MTTPLLIYGCGGHGRELLALVEDLRREGAPYEVVAFVSDDAEWHGRMVAGVRVLPWDDALRHTPAPSVVMGMGSPAAKRRIAERIAGSGAQFPTLIHPAARVGPRTELDTGVVIAAGSILTCDIRVGRFAMVNRLCNVGHDCTIGAWSLIGPGSNLSGGVTIGDGCDLGTGVDLIPGVAVGAWSILGAGAVVAKDIPANVTAAGVPARVLRRRQEGQPPT